MVTANKHEANMNPPMHCEICAFNADKLLNVRSKGNYLLTLHNCIDVSFVHGNLHMFQQLLDAPQDQVCKCFIHESDHSNGPEVRGGSCIFRFFGNIWYIPFFQDDGIALYAKFGS